MCKSGQTLQHQCLFQEDYVTQALDWTGQVYNGTAETDPRMQFVALKDLPGFKDITLEDFAHYAALVRNIS